MPTNDHASHLERLQALLDHARRDHADDYVRLRIAALPDAGSAMAYYELGDLNGAPLLCLHGLSLSGFFFERYHAHFAERGIRAIAPCLLGGICLPDPNKTMAALGAEIVELLDRLDITRFDMVGFSWGTLLQLELIGRVPHRVGRAGLLGPMLPLAFLDASQTKAMKPDIRRSLAMVRHVPQLHRALMWLVCRLPVSVLVEQFRDDRLSSAELDALAAGTDFNRHLALCIEECRRTGSRFFTQGWRMFLDRPGYVLDELSSPAAQRIDLRLYVAGQDNVHLPAFAQGIADACSGRGVGSGGTRAGAYRHDHTHGNCSVWVMPQAGRMACMVHFEEALDHLMAQAAVQGLLSRDAPSAAA